MRSLCWLIGGTAAVLFLVLSLHEWREGWHLPQHPSRVFFLAVFGCVMPFGVLALHMLVRSGSLLRRFGLGLLTTVASYFLFGLASCVYSVPMGPDLRPGVLLRFSLEDLRDLR